MDHFDNELADLEEENDVMGVIRDLPAELRATRETLAAALDTDPEWVDPVVARLVASGTLEIVGDTIQPTP